jgi:hypothetical protein
MSLSLFLVMVVSGFTMSSVSATEFNWNVNQTFHVTSITPDFTYMAFDDAGTELPVYNGVGSGRIRAGVLSTFIYYGNIEIINMTHKNPYYDFELRALYEGSFDFPEIMYDFPVMDKYSLHINN